MMEEEVWKDIEGYEGLYQVSNLGRVKSLPNSHHSEEIIMSQVVVNGYYNVSLCKKGKKKMYRIHRLVAEAFIPNPNYLPHVGHKDEKNFKSDNECNNRVDNLEWCDAKQNSNMPKHLERITGENGNFYGCHHTEETKAKLSAANIGKIVPEEIKAKISQTLRNKSHFKDKKITCENKTFKNMRECAEYYNINYSTLRSWMQGVNPIPKKWKEKGLKVVEN